MEISSIVGGASPTDSQSKKSDEVNQQDFLNLLTTQLKNQNPLEPVQDSEFLGQLAQFSSLEESKAQTSAIEKLANSMAANTGLQSLSQASSLIGKNIQFYNENNAIVSADVVGVEFNENGLQLKTNDGNLVSLGLVASITEQGAELATSETDTEEENTQA